MQPQDKQVFCVLGNAMNAENMNLGEDVSKLSLGLTLLFFSLLALSVVI